MLPSCGAGRGFGHGRADLSRSLANSRNLFKGLDEEDGDGHRCAGSQASVADVGRRCGPLVPVRVAQSISDDAAVPGTLPNDQCRECRERGAPSAAIPTSLLLEDRLNNRPQRFG